jgi:uridylate kinase
MRVIEVTDDEVGVVLTRAEALLILNDLGQRSPVTTVRSAETNPNATGFRKMPEFADDSERTQLVMGIYDALLNGLKP